MRKYVIALLSLMLFAVGGLCAIHIVTDIPKDQVVLTETTLLGEKTAADGLKLQVNSTLNDRLLWKTTHLTGTEPETTTDFSFHSEGIRWETAVTYDGIRLGSGMNHGVSVNAPIESLSPLELVYRELYDNTEPGRESTAIVRLADIYDYYPITIELHFAGSHFFHYSEEAYDSDMSVEQKNKLTPAQLQGMKFTEYYRDYFKIPMLPNQIIEISVRKNPNSSIAGVGSRAGLYEDDSSDSFDMYTMSAMTDDAVYFVFDAHTARGEIVDVSQIAGGFGVYCQPYKEFENPAFILDPEDLSNILPLDPSIRFADLTYNPRYRQLELLTIENGEAVLYVIDTVTNTLTQRLVISALPEDASLWIIESDDDHMLLRAGGTALIVVAADGTGQYSTRFTVPCRGDTMMNVMLYAVADTAWDGEKLAVISHMENLYDQNDFYLAVLSDSGIDYLGEYRSSLSTDTNSGDYRQHVHAADLDALRAEWVG